MASLSERSEVGELFDRMTLGVAKTLEKKPGVTDVRLLDKKPVDKSAIYSWEQRNMCFLPSDLKDFYLTTDGILIQWSIQFDGGTLPIGKIEINAIATLTPLNQTRTVSEENPHLLDIDDLSDDEDFQGNTKPHFDDRSKIFELDSCFGFAKVCLVYKDVKTGITDCKPEIWLLDRSLRWTFLASSFQSYFRMLIVHLGIPLWQYHFTPAGMSPETKQWFNMYAPSRLSDDTNKTESDIEATDTSCNEELVNQLDANRVFKGKQETAMKNRTSQAKKKTTTNCKTNPASRSGLQGLFNNLERVQKRACKIILGYGNYTSYDEALVKLNLPSLETRRESLCRKLFTKTRKDKSSKLFDLLPPEVTHSYSLRKPNLFNHVKFNTNRFGNTFTMKCARHKM